MKSGEYVVFWFDRDTTQSVGILRGDGVWERAYRAMEMPKPFHIVRPHREAEFGPPESRAKRKEQREPY